MTDYVTDTHALIWYLEDKESLGPAASAANEDRLTAALLVKLRRFFECCPLFVVVAENHQPDLLSFDQIK